MKLLKFNRNALVQLFFLLIGFQMFFSVINLMSASSMEYKSNYMSSVGTLYLLLFPFIMMLSMGNISVNISLSMGSTRRQLMGGLAGLNVLCCAVVCASQWGGLWLLNRLFGLDEPVFLARFPRLAILTSAFTLVLGELGLLMGMCSQRWGGKALLLCGLAELVMLGAAITWFVLNLMKGGAADAMLEWILSAGASAADFAALTAGCALAAAVLHAPVCVLLKKAVVKL